VSQAVVLMHEVTPDDKRLVAYLVPTDDTEVNVHEIRDSLAARLPNYMLPHFWMVVPEIPITPNGKINRAVLPVPSFGEPYPELTTVIPDSAFERVMYQIWAELLGTQVSNKDVDFFELGGHSLLAIRLIYRLNELFSMQINPRLIFEFPNLGDFISSIRKSSKEADQIEKNAEFLLNLQSLSEGRANETLNEKNPNKPFPKLSKPEA
jgi:acyl carrier protein